VNFTTLNPTPLAIGCLVLAVVAFLLAIHPFVTYPLSLRLTKRLRSATAAAAPTVRPGTDAQPLRFAMCTCAYNEEANIEDKVENLLALRDVMPDLEILIYVDGSADRTADILSRYADRITLHVSPERHGKTHGMNLLVGMATADILVCTDANVMVGRRALPVLRQHFADAEVGCVCGSLTYVNGRDSATAANGSLYWRLEESVKRLETHHGSVMGADGSLFAIRRALYEPAPEHLIDDMYVSLKVLCQGYRIVQATDVLAFEETVPASREEFRRKARIACQAFNVHRLLWPQLRRLSASTVYRYVSHKLLRWLTIYSLAASALFALLAIALSGQPLVSLALLVSGTVLGVAAVRWPMGPLSRIADIVVAFAGTGYGVWQSLRGEQHRTWAPAQSIRAGSAVAERSS